MKMEIPLGAVIDAVTSSNERVRVACVKNTLRDIEECGKECALVSMCSMLVCTPEERHDNNDVMFYTLAKEGGAE